MDVERCKETINRLAPQYSRLSKTQIRELEKATEELKGIQRACSHVYEPVQLFNTVKSICSYCDKEDTGYDHFRHGKAFTRISTDDDDDDGWSSP
jgi:hypothetical protein